MENNKLYVKEILEKLSKEEGDSLIEKLRPISTVNRPSGRKKMRTKIRKDDFVTLTMLENSNLHIVYYNVVLDALFRGGDLEVFVGRELLKQL